jgi:hypothetical protein
MIFPVKGRFARQYFYLIFFLFLVYLYKSRLELWNLPIQVIKVL